jgi:hypothetical protein
MLVSLLLVPLILLVFKIDKSKVFLVVFFGYSVHVFSFYINLIGVNMGIWNYPIQVVSWLPSLSFDSSLVPVTFMLVYQWTLNNKKNYFIFALITSIVFSFIIEPIFVNMDLFKLYGNINYLHRLIGYVILSFNAKFITDLFLKLQRYSVKQTGS